MGRCRGIQALPIDAAHQPLPLRWRQGALRLYRRSAGEATLMQAPLARARHRAIPDQEAGADCGVDCGKA